MQTLVSCRTAIQLLEDDTHRFLADYLGEIPPDDDPTAEGDAQLAQSSSFLDGKDMAVAPGGESRDGKEGEETPPNKNSKEEEEEEEEGGNRDEEEGRKEAEEGEDDNGEESTHGSPAPYVYHEHHDKPFLIQAKRQPVVVNVDTT